MIKKYNRIMNEIQIKNKFQISDNGIKLKKKKD